MQVFEADFDNRKEAVKQFGATMQSKLTAYQADTEAGRSSGETRPAADRALLDKAL